MKVLEKEASYNTPWTEHSPSALRESRSPLAPIPFRLWFKKLCVTVLISLATFASAEGLTRFIVAQNPPTISHAREFDRKFMLAQTPNQPQQAGIIILGDSLIDFSVYSDLLAAQLQKAGIPIPVQNLAVPGNSYRQDLLLLKTAIKAGNQPSLVIVNAHLRLFNQNYEKSQAQNYKAFKESYLNRCLTGERLSWPDSTRCQLEKQSFLLRYRNFFKTELNQLSVTLFSPKKRMAYTPSLFPATEFSPTGWTPGYSVYSPAEFQEKYSSPTHYKQVASDLKDFQWTDNPDFKQLAEFCQLHHINLLVIWPPEHPINAKAYQHFGLSRNELGNKMTRAIQQNGLRFISFRDRLPDAEAYMDPEHVNPEGAVRFTKQLVQTLLQNRKTLLKIVLPLPSGSQQP